MKDTCLYAFLQGFFEHIFCDSDCGRTHDTSHDWNVWYDRGWNVADAIQGRAPR